VGEYPAQDYLVYKRVVGTRPGLPVHMPIPFVVKNETLLDVVYTKYGF
jgi:hypothetical protein